MAAFPRGPPAEFIDASDAADDGRLAVWAASFLFPQPAMSRTDATRTAPGAGRTGRLSETCRERFMSLSDRGCRATTRKAERGSENVIWFAPSPGRTDDEM